MKGRTNVSIIFSIEERNGLDGFFFGSVNRQIDNNNNNKKCAQIDVVCHRYYGNGPRETVTERSNLMGCMSEYMDRYYAK